MKCLECGFEGVLEGDKYCGKCGKALKIETGSKWEKPEWKWGSMIVSLGLTIIYLISTYEYLFWAYEYLYWDYSREIIVIIFILVIIFLMYREREKSEKFGLLWFLFPLVILIATLRIPTDDVYYAFIFLIIPAITIDFIYVFKIEWKWSSMIASIILIFIFWIILWDPYFRYQDYGESVLIISGLLGFPAFAYLMYKERKDKIKYGLTWILLPMLIFLYFVSYDDVVFLFFLIFIVPAFIIDLIYVSRAKNNRL